MYIVTTGQKMRINSTVICLALGLFTIPAVGQQITLSVVSLGNYVNPAAQIGPLTLGTVQTTTATTVTLTSATSFLWFTKTGNCAAGNRSQTISLPTAGSPPSSSITACLINLPTGGVFYALLSASATGYPTTSAAAVVTSNPGGLVTASPAIRDITLAPQTVTITNGATGNLSAALYTFAPSNPAWLVESENVPCKSVSGPSGSCVVTLSANPNAPALSAGTTYTAQVGFSANGNLGSVAVTYKYNPPALRFIPITPCRIADTRNPTGAFGGPILAGNTSRDFAIPAASCGSFASAQAYSINVTVVPSGGIGFLSVWPSGQTRPVVSTLNSDGRVKANAAIVPAGSAGAISVYTSDPTHVILDINGYFVPASNTSALEFYPLPPCRVVDTRNQAGAFGGPLLSAGVSRDFAIRSSACNVPSAAQAYSLNFTAVPRGLIGFFTAWPSGNPQPGTSVLNANFQSVTANASIVPAGSAGAISVYSSHDTDMVIDINGYFGPPATGGLSFYNQSPCRVLDTRNTSSNPFSGELDVTFVAGSCGLPAVAQAFVSNATVVPSGPLGFLALWPQGQAQPNVSTLNSDGSVASNMAIVPTTNGSIASYVSNPSQLILDVSGYFAP